MIQPLRFPTAPPAPAVSKGPKPLAFAPVPPSVPNKESFENEASAIQTRFGPERVPLQFGTTPAPTKPVGPKPLGFAPAPPAPPVPSGEVRAVFQQTMSPLAKSAVEELKRSYPAEYAQRGPLLERQINQLLPIDLSKVLGWASNSLTDSGEISTECGKLVREFMDAKGNVVVDETMKIINGKLSFFEKISNRDGDVTTKPQLVVLRMTHTQLLERVTQLLQDANLAAERLVNKMTSLRVINDVCGTNLPDITLSNALHQRQVLIAQAATQAQLTIQQLKDVRMQIADQLARVEQLLVATIPAYENAKARR